MAVPRVSGGSWESTTRWWQRCTHTDSRIKANTTACAISMHMRKQPVLGSSSAAALRVSGGSRRSGSTWWWGCTHTDSRIRANTKACTISVHIRQRFAQSPTVESTINTKAIARSSQGKTTWQTKRAAKETTTTPVTKPSRSATSTAKGSRR